MAFVDGATVIATASGMPAEQAIESVQKPAIAPGDLRRVRLAMGMTAALLMVDLALYVPRFF
jgi:hypothetical protein